VQYQAHHPMQHVQGYTRSHWTLPLGDYLLRIAPAATTATTTKTCINGRGGALVQYCMHCPMEEV
jgi:hypothetical protein